MVIFIKRFVELAKLKVIVNKNIFMFKMQSQQANAFVFCNKAIIIVFNSRLKYNPYQKIANFTNGFKFSEKFSEILT